MREYATIQFDKSADVLMDHQTFRDMVSFVKHYSNIDPEKVLTKILDITPYEINNLQYTNTQFRRLKDFCIRYGFDPDINTLEQAILGEQMPIDKSNII